MPRRGGPGPQSVSRRQGGLYVAEHLTRGTEGGLDDRDASAAVGKDVAVVGLAQLALTVMDERNGTIQVVALGDKQTRGVMTGARRQPDPILRR